MMRVETSVTGFTVWLIISAGIVGGMQSRRDVAQRGQGEFGRKFRGDRHIEQAGERGKFRLPAEERRPCSNRSGCSTAPPVMSSGLCGVPKLGSAARSSATAAVDSSGSGTFEHLRAIGDDFARAAGDRHHGQAARLQHAGAGDDIGGEQQVLDRIHAHDAELAAHAVEHTVVADQRAGVRLRRNVR